MNAKQIKLMGCWGRQMGLLSEAEIDTLIKAIDRHTPTNVLEIGHYCGLSTYVICKALSVYIAPQYRWNVLSIDAHVKDNWVLDSEFDKYLANKHNHFNDARVQSLVMRSESITDIDGFDMVFYDGDHGEEQIRFTKMVHATPDVQLFIFDDRDFTHPARCCEYLITNGWIDESPPCQRLTGDKVNPDTMTLAIFTR